jgi:hypothetical protein
VQRQCLWCAHANKYSDVSRFDKRTFSGAQLVQRLIAMSKRKPKVFVASTFDLKDERTALNKLFKEFEKKVDFSGYEAWEGGVAEPASESIHRASQSDYFILILGGRYGSRSLQHGIGITECEYRNFLYTHAKEYDQDRDILQIFLKDPSTISPEQSDVLGENLNELNRFIVQLQKRHSIPPPFKDWRELPSKIENLLHKIPSLVPQRTYCKVSIHQFDFKILGIGPFRERQVKAAWANCPCSVHESKGCEFEKPMHYKPPKHLRREMQRHLKTLWRNVTTNPQWKHEQPSFKTISIQEHEGKVWPKFCHSTWHQFLGTNQAATKDESIKNILQATLSKGAYLERSPFSNNLGLAIAVIDRKSEAIYSNSHLG